MWKKVLLLFCTLIVGLFLFVVPWQYELGIEHNLIHLDSAPIAKEIPTAGLGGPGLFYVGVNKHNNNQILVQGADLYLSLDKGNSWRKLARHFERVLWLGPHLVAEADDKLFLSKDLGESWLPLTLPSTIDNNSKPPSSLGLHTLANHDPILVARSYQPEGEVEEGTWRDMELTYQNDQVNFVEHTVNTDEWVQYDNHGSKLKFAHGAVDAYLYATDQEEWAATEGGLFFREKDKTQWKEISANWQATSETYIIQSANSEKLLALDRIGRLYLSKDRAITWTKLLNNVTAASFLPDDSVLAAHQDLSAKLITGDATTEITPSRQEMRNAHEAMDLMVSATNTPFKFLEAHLVGGTHRHIWMALGGPTYFENLPYQNSQYDLISARL